MEDLKFRILQVANSHNSRTIVDEAYKLMCELGGMSGSYQWIDKQFNECCYNDGIIISVYSSIYHESIIFIVDHTYTCYTNIIGGVYDIDTSYVDCAGLIQIHNLFAAEKINNVVDLDDLLLLMESFITDDRDSVN